MLTELLEITGGVTAVIGSGGKTTLLRTLGEELAAQGGTVLLCTTTHIFPFDDLTNLFAPTREALQAALRQKRLVCAGTPELRSGKLTALDIPMAQLAGLADYVLVEADGSHRLPLKAHAAHEPCIPAEANRTVCVVGLSGLGRSAAEAAHRPERFAALAEMAQDAPVTAAALARVLNRERLADCYFINQADTPERWEWARTLGQLLERPAVAGSLLKGAYFSC
jgi:probable selenium-dependent hydroxylase accessory protein YqeC